MSFNNILSKNHQNLNLLAEKESGNYKNAIPFPSIVFENFFDESFLDEIAEDFPDLSKLDSSQKYMNKNELILLKNYL